MSNNKRRTSKQLGLASERAKRAQTADEVVAAAVSCRQKIQQIDLRFRGKFCRWLGHTYDIAFQFLHNDEAWRKFTKDDHWKGRRQRPTNSKKGRSKVLIWTMRYVLFDGQNENYSRAYIYARGLQAFFDKGVRPERISRLISKNGGIESLYRKAVKKSKRKRAQKVLDHTISSDHKRDQDTKRATKLGAKQSPIRSSIVAESPFDNRLKPQHARAPSRTDPRDLGPKVNSQTGSESMERGNDLPSTPLDEKAHDVLKDLDRLRSAVVAYFQKCAEDGLR